MLSYIVLKSKFIIQLGYFASVWIKTKQNLIWFNCGWVKKNNNSVVTNTPPLLDKVIWSYAPLSPPSSRDMLEFPPTSVTQSLPWVDEGVGEDLPLCSGWSVAPSGTKYPPKPSSLSILNRRNLSLTVHGRHKKKIKKIKNRLMYKMNNFKCDSSGEIWGKSIIFN